jgi:hypothetical protein
MHVQTLNDIASDSLLPQNDRDMAELLIAACNDWPEVSLTDPGELVSRLEQAIPGALTLGQLTIYRASLSLAHDAWKAESTTSVIAFMQRAIHQGLPEDTPVGDAIAHFGQRCGYG